MTKPSTAAATRYDTEHMRAIQVSIDATPYTAPNPS
jgi:hypothetical protein